MIEILGWREMLELKGGGSEFWYEECPQYEIFYKQDWQTYCCTLENEYGSCSSWRTSATWASSETFLFADSVWELHYIPIKKVILDNIEDFVNVDEDWGCCRYSTGHAEIKDKYLPLFQQTPRAKTTRPVFVFKGWSWLGKSFIARNTSLSVYETDYSSVLPENIEADIIVIGNKYEFWIKDLEGKIYWWEIIEVTFN